MFSDGSGWEPRAGGGRCLTKIWFGLAIILAYPSREIGIFYSFKLFLPAFTALRGTGGREGAAPCGNSPFPTAMASAVLMYSSCAQQYWRELPSSQQMTQGWWLI